MAFDKAASRQPTAIGTIEVVLVSPDPESAESPYAQARVHIKYSNGDIEEWAGSLVPHITVAQRNGLLAFVADLRTQAEAEFLAP